MFIANAQSDSGKMLVLGFSKDNMDDLRNDMPITKDLGDIIPELDGWKLVILGPEDMERFIAQTEVNVN